MLPAHLTQTALSMYLTELEQSSYSVSHRARLKAAVGGFAQWLIKEGFALQRNPADGIEIPAETMRAPRQLSKTQCLILRELVEKADDLRGAAMFALGYWAGCRVSDVSWLRMRDAHINQRVGQIRVGYKGGKWREIDLVNAVRRPLYNYIKESRRYQDSEYIFTSQKSPRLTEAGIHHWWRSLKAQASKADWSITFHDLRHDFAHRAREKGWTFSLSLPIGAMAQSPPLMVSFSLWAALKLRPHGSAGIMAANRDYSSIRMFQIRENLSSRA